MIGRVVSVKMTKTAVVLVESKKTHQLYGKSYAWSKRYLVDDQIGVTLGDIVIFEKIKPISKHKHWRIAKVLGKDIVSLEQAELQEEAAEAIAEVMPEEKEKDQLSVLSSQVSENGQPVVSELVEKIKTEKQKTSKSKPENRKSKVKKEIK